MVDLFISRKFINNILFKIFFFQVKNKERNLERENYDQLELNRREKKFTSSRSYEEKSRRSQKESNNELEPFAKEAAALLNTKSKSTQVVTKSDTTEDQEIVEDFSQLSEEEAMERRIQSLRPTARPIVYNLAYFANSNKTLQTFIEMGVMIREWDKDTSIGSFVLQLDLDRDVKPRLIFLHDLGLPAETHASIITKNPHIFRESLDDLNVRVEYLRSKRFSDEAIRTIITKAPRW